MHGSGLLDKCEMLCIISADSFMKTRLISLRSNSVSEKVSSIRLWILSELHATV